MQPMRKQTGRIDSRILATLLFGHPGTLHDMAGLSTHRREQRDMHREVAGMYKRRAGFPFADEFQRERNDILVSMAPEGRELRAVDLGCGTGILLHHLSARYEWVAGLDLSQEMLAGYEPERSAPDGTVRLLCGDMTLLPIADQSVDIVYCRSALHHMDDEIAVLSEMRRILKPDGRLIVGEPANDNPVFRLARWWVRRRPSFGRIHTIDRAYTRSQLRELLERSGLQVRREHRFGFLAYTLCDNPELVPILRWLPEKLALSVSRGLRRLDRGLSRVPLVRHLSWYVMLEAEHKR